jgi:hypothetical protein
VSAADGTISHSQLNKLTRSIYPPLGVGADASKQEARGFIQKCKIVQICPGRYTFEHTAFALVAALGEIPLSPSLPVKRFERVFAKHILKVSCLIMSTASWQWIAACLFTACLQFSLHIKHLAALFINAGTRPSQVIQNTLKLQKLKIWG